MNSSIIAAPLIGAVIGYATNYIAVKMMFRPLNPVKLGKYTLPFTPGIIPKGKPRLARAIGNVIETSLLSKDILEETLLSDEMKAKVSQGVHQSLIKLQDDERNLHELITTYIEEEHFDVYKANTIDYIANRINKQLQEKPVGSFIASEVIKTVKEHLKGGLLGLMANDSFLNPIGVRIQQGIDDYLKENALVLVVPPITEECDKLLNQPMNSLGEVLASHEETITSGILKFYEELVSQHLGNIFNSINIASIVENRINAMDTKEMEELILSIMKKELNAIVNLGALIGFILGLFNLFFQ